MKIAYVEKSTLIDYPGKIACTVFTQGCNFSCGYCHNPELISFTNNKSYLDEKEFLKFLNLRIGKLDAVCITGGEPTIQKDLSSFIKKIKKLGFLVKLDTQGSMPSVIKNLLENELLDYIAMDIKAPLEKYSDITYSKINTKRVNETINIIMQSGVDYEFRTTIVKDQLTKSDMQKIGKLIKGSKKYYLQRFVPTKVNDKGFMQKKSYSQKTLIEFRQLLKEYVDDVYIR